MGFVGLDAAVVFLVFTGQTQPSCGFQSVSIQALTCYSGRNTAIYPSPGSTVLRFPQPVVLAYCLMILHLMYLKTFK